MPTTIRPAQMEDGDAVLELFDRELGEGYIDRQTIERSITEPESAICLVATNPTDGIVGASSMLLLDRDDLRSHIPHDQRDLIDRLGFTELERIGYRQGLAIKPEYRGGDLADRMVEKGYYAFRRREATAILSIAWKSPEGCLVASLLERHEFERLEEIERFWFEDSQLYGYSCPNCGRPCSCSALIYLRRLY